MSQAVTIVPFTKRETAILLALAKAVLEDPALSKYFNLDSLNSKGELELDAVKTKLEDFLE